MSDTSIKLTGFDNFLIGMAYMNHASYFDEIWASKETNIPTLALAYPIGMCEHMVFAVFKVCAVVSFFFITCALSVYSLVQKIRGKLTESDSMRLKISLLTFCEAIPGAMIDALGMLCPPVAYAVHKYIKENLTLPLIDMWTFNYRGKSDLITSSALDHFNLVFLNAPEPEKKMTKKTA